MKTFVALSMVALLATVVASAQVAFAERPDQETATRAIEIARRAGAKAVEIRDFAASKGIDVAQANALIEAGERSLSEAQNALSEGKYGEASGRAKAAMENFRNAIAALRQVADKERGNGKDKEHGGSIEERVQKFQAMIERLRASVNKLREALDKVPEGVSPSVVNKIKSSLNAADGHLNGAEGKLRSPHPNFEQVADDIKKAKEELEQANAGFKEIAEHLKGNKLGGSVEKLREFADKLGKKLDAAAEKGIRVDDLRARLSTAQSLIHEAAKKFENGDRSGAMASLREAGGILDSIARELKSRGTGSTG